MDVSQVVAIAGALISAEAVAIGVLWRALLKSQEARIKAAQQHDRDLEEILQEIRRKGGAQ